MTRVLFWLTSAIWSLASEAARIGVAAGLLKQTKLPSRVVSVGNIQVGGAGKTPLVARIAREAHARGLNVCILCRGYGGEWELSGGVIAPGDPNRDAGQCGDEAALLHDLVPEAFIGVGADRVEQFEKIRKRMGIDPDLVILDDGFQHWKLYRDLEIVAVTSTRRTQTLFRDRGQALRHADLVVWTKGETAPNTYGKPRVKVRFRVPAQPMTRPIWLVTGLADGGAARASIQEAGYRVDKHIPFPDHARYAETTVQGILEAASANGCAVAITGKDWVKWRELGVSQTRVQVLEPELIFEEGEELWSRLLWGK